MVYFPMDLLYSFHLNLKAEPKDIIWQWQGQAKLQKIAEALEVVDSPRDGAKIGQYLVCRTIAYKWATFFLESSIFLIYIE